MTTSYCLDSGVFINSWTKHYPPELFPAIWAHLDMLCRAKLVFVPSEVAKEVYDGDDAVAAWLKERRKVVVRPNEDIILQQKEIVGTFPRLTAEGSTRSAADPWVIAFAFKRDAVLVTEEQKSRNPNPGKPKIPDVCDVLGVKWINTVGLLRETGFKPCLCHQPTGPVASPANPS